MPQYALMSLNMPGHGWIFAGCTWIGPKILEQTVLTRSGPESFQDRGGFVKLWHFDKLFIKKHKKKAPAGKHFGAFSPSYF